MIDPRSIVGRILAILLPLPALLLAVFTLRANHLPDPVYLVGPSGDSLLGMVLRSAPGDSPETLGVLDADGGHRRIPSGAAVVDADSTWILWRDDAPFSMGRLVGVVVEAGDTLRGPRSGEAVERMPGPLSRDEQGLRERLRTASTPGDSVRCSLALARFLAHQRQVVALLQVPGRSLVAVPLVRIRHAESFRGGWTDSWVRTAKRVWFRISALPDAASGGGIRIAVVATFLVVLLSGLLGGIPSLLLAVHLADPIDPGPGVRWLRWASEGLSGVPGVVWGCVGAAFLAHLAASGGWSATVGFPIGPGILWAGLTLGVLSAPITFTRAMEAVDRVPRSSREIARSCGATRHQVLLWVVLPACRRGLAGAWFSGLARAAGETAPLLLVGAAGGWRVDSHSGGSLPSLSGEFLHLGAMAYQQQWPAVEARMGHPLAFLSLSVLAGLCLSLEWLAMRWNEVRR